MEQQEKPTKMRFTSLEKSWILYDVGNSAFTLLVTTLIPIWFHMLASDAGLSESMYLAQWSYAISVATIVIAILGPVVGSITDNKGYKKKIFAFTVIAGAVFCAMMGFIADYMAYLIVFAVTKVLYSSSLIYYDSMLGDITTEDRMDEVSSKGYAYGYIGSTIPFILAIVFYLLGVGGVIPIGVAMAAGFVLTAAWWLGVSVPLLKRYQQKNYVEVTSEHKIAESFARLGRTLVDIVRNEHRVLLFLIAFFFFIDGVYTIIDEAVAIGTALGLDQVALLVVLLLTQVVAFTFATLFGRLSRRYDVITLISICIGGYLFVAIFGFFMHSLWQFGIMAFVVGMFQGAIQALSRSYYAKIIPAEKSGEYFGLYDIFGKGAAFLGTMLVGVTTQVTGSINYAVGSLAVMFVLGFVFLRLSASRKLAQPDR